MPLTNDPTLFASDALAGFAASQHHRVLSVHGGVVRATQTPSGQVAVIMGGGSGHFPAFAGWVGAGFGHGAACGNTFASPSASQIYSVAKAADSGGGLMFVPINYAGDILHFSAAADMLRAEGIDVRMVPITDDIASGPADAVSTRRGIAGSFIAIKIIGAAAERGLSLDEAERIGSDANAATRSFGVAFSGCTLPGASEPLFSVPAGRVAIGLGIHGEPGIDDVPLGSADDIADILVDGLFAERSAVAGQRVAVLVNGLGSTKYDELFTVFGRVHSRIESAGMHLVGPVVGEQVTSLDMAGLSLSITYLDDQLEQLWLAPADAATFSLGAVEAAPPREAPSEDVGPATIPPSSEASRTAASIIAAALAAARDAIATNETRLGEIDAVAGDGDHGIGMARGIGAAAASAEHSVARGAGAGTLLALAAAEWSEQGGGTSGALWGAGLAAAGVALGDDDGANAGVAARAFLTAIVDRGSAELGDKTMVDAIVPFVETLERTLAEGLPLYASWAAAAATAHGAAERTADIVSRRGRSKLHGSRSLGSPDAGAISFAVVVSAALT